MLCVALMILLGLYATYTGCGAWGLEHNDGENVQK